MTDDDFDLVLKKYDELADTESVTNKKESTRRPLCILSHRGMICFRRQNYQNRFYHLHYYQTTVRLLGIVTISGGRT
jgi:hypothetical protein